MCVLDHTGRTETEVPTCQSFISNASPRTAQLLDTGTPSPKFGVAGVTLLGSGLDLLLKRADRAKTCSISTITDMEHFDTASKLFFRNCYILGFRYLGVETGYWNPNPGS